MTHFLIDRFVIDINGVEVVGQYVAKDGGGGTEFGYYLLGAGDMLQLVGEHLPLSHELAQVGIELGYILAFCYGADNDSEIGWLDALDEATQSAAFFTALDFL